MQLWAINLWQRRQEYTREKTVSLISGSGETEQSHVESEIRTRSNTVCKNKLKMDLRPKCKTRYKKLLEGNVDRTLFNINHSNIFLDLSPRTLEIKKKDKQMVTFS